MEKKKKERKGKKKKKKAEKNETNGGGFCSSCFGFTKKEVEFEHKKSQLEFDLKDGATII